jgi:hypothetical protein
MAGLLLLPNENGQGKGSNDHAGRLEREVGDGEVSEVVLVMIQIDLEREE